MAALGENAPGLGIGMVGYAFMGRAHSHAWRSVGPFFDPPLRPEMTALAGRNAAKVQGAARELGWASTETDWKALLRRDDIGLIDICTPGDGHAEIAIAALDAGKHVLCEKPLANSVAEAEAMVAAADRARERGVRSMVAFNYRRVPAIALARRLVAEGRLGTIRHVRAQYLQDWLADPGAPWTWRMDKERAGSGALGDIAAHIIDTTQFVTGQQITDVSALLRTFVHERPHDGGTRPVTVDDAALFIGRTSGGATASFEATRFATGRKNSLRIELNGSQGSLAFDLESLNELWFHDAAEDSLTGGFRRILVTEAEHPYMAAWWPPGHIIGYEHTFTHEIADLLTAIAGGTDPSPSFADGLQVQRVLAAVAESAETGTWRTT
ncbi:Gfo/Idh/MocA family oxidoreductase [Actinomadura barringtoniae]|uniref:Gfo/Idh/MocA family oxidoreductase n=1 Tax=Actinomadura barringtoniae TaxID=1427535 RepID=A0A939PDS1_9ACTN|nr:Gfo/Idh/MocA family oxidoreductase [Actinomadura barringtoniae]MBO2450377.1 Gfo/Idh/MocA family oxidoreductase [Actinomadura barringtoniae]